MKCPTCSGGGAVVNIMGELDVCPECHGDTMIGIREMLQYATVSCTGTTITIECEDLDVKEALFDWLTGEST